MKTWRILGFALASCLILGAAAPAPASDAIGRWLFQKPALSATDIVFVFAGDLWTVPRAGGEAKRLTSSPGSETNPVFSPDGSTIAFTGEYDGNVDVFVMPAAGGVPRRLTWHPAADVALGWTPDGRRVLFTSGRESYSRFSELFTAGLDGGLEEKLPLPMGNEAAYSPDGSRLAYVPIGRAFSAWKRYRGGRTTPLWIANLSDSAIEKIPRPNSNDFNPMWAGDKVYFLSDREGAVALFAWDTKAKKVTRAFASGEFELKSAAAGPGAIVYEQFGGLGLYDLKTGQASPVPITVSGDMPEVRERYVSVGESPVERRRLPERRPRRVRGPRGDRHRARRKRRPPQPHQHRGRHGTRARLVARRKNHRLFLGRVGRVHAAPPAPGRRGRDRQDRARREAVFL